MSEHMMHTITPGRLNSKPASHHSGNVHYSYSVGTWFEFHDDTFTNLLKVFVFRASQNLAPAWPFKMDPF